MKETKNLLKLYNKLFFSFSVAYNTHSQYPQGWGVQPTAPPNQGYSYSNQQPYPPPPPSSQTLPPPTYAENVVSGQPPLFAS